MVQCHKAQHLGELPLQAVLVLPYLPANITAFLKPDRMELSVPLKTLRVDCRQDGNAVRTIWAERITWIITRGPPAGNDLPALALLRHREPNERPLRLLNAKDIRTEHSQRTVPGPILLV
jgi:hypothetical protein